MPVDTVKKLISGRACQGRQTHLIKRPKPEFLPQIFALTYRKPARYREISSLSEKSPRCLIKFGSHKIWALLDTGAQFTVIREDQYHKIPQKCKLALNTEVWRNLRAANNAPIIMKGIATLEMELGGQKFKHDCVIVKNLFRPMLLGTEFLAKNHAIINYDQERLMLKGATVTLLGTEEPTMGMLGQKTRPPRRSFRNQPRGSYRQPDNRKLAIRSQRKRQRQSQGTQTAFTGSHLETRHSEDRQVRKQDRKKTVRWEDPVDDQEPSWNREGPVETLQDPTEGPSGPSSRNPREPREEEVDDQEPSWNREGPVETLQDPTEGPSGPSSRNPREPREEEVDDQEPSWNREGPVEPLQDPTEGPSGPSSRNPRRTQRRRRGWPGNELEPGRTYGRTTGPT